MSNRFEIDGSFAQKAKRTATNFKTTKTYNHAATIIRHGDKVADYGCGPWMNFESVVSSAGATYVPFDRFHGMGSLREISDSDVVVLSNVLNVACKHDDPEAAYYQIIKEAFDSVKESGYVVANIPSSGPRCDWMSSSRLLSDLSMIFKNTKKIGDVVQAQGKIIDAYYESIKDKIDHWMREMNRKSEHYKKNKSSSKIIGNIKSHSSQLEPPLACDN